MYVNVTLRRVLIIIFAVEKQYILHSLSVSIASVIQHLERMRRIVVCGLSGCTVFFHVYLINDKIFGKKLLNINPYPTNVENRVSS